MQVILVRHPRSLCDFPSGVILSERRPRISLEQCSEVPKECQSQTEPERKRSIHVFDSELHRPFASLRGTICLTELQNSALEAIS